ncbi:MAG: hypothetical protein M5U08_26335 [Burkholderiales bacterium]|nr:hypothetical protein [Burkholderiales bacterium]
MTADLERAAVRAQPDARRAGSGVQDGRSRALRVELVPSHRPGVADLDLQRALPGFDRFVIARAAPSQQNAATSTAASSPAKGRIGHAPPAANPAPMPNDVAAIAPDMRAHPRGEIEHLRLVFTRNPAAPDAIAPDRDSSVIGVSCRMRAGAGFSTRGRRLPRWISLVLPPSVLPAGEFNIRH